MNIEDERRQAEPRRFKQPEGQWVPMANAGDSDEPEGAVEWIKWALTTDEGWAAYARDILGSALVVLLIGGLLFGISGVWPPMVAIESGSMEPNIQKGDLVFVMEEHRFSASDALAVNGESTGVIPYSVGETSGHKSFGMAGDVIVYKPHGTDATPIIHRARFWVESGEDWYEKADKKYVGNVSNCSELKNCPAPHSGFITKGDNNGQYDQVGHISSPVKPDWIIGTAKFRIPFLGYIRLGTGMVSGVAGFVTSVVPAFVSSVGPSALGVGLLGGTLLIEKESGA